MNNSVKRELFVDKLREKEWGTVYLDKYLARVGAEARQADRKRYEEAYRQFPDLCLVCNEPAFCGDNELCYKHLKK